MGRQPAWGWCQAWGGVSPRETEGSHLTGLSGQLLPEQAMLPWAAGPSRTQPAPGEKPVETGGPGALAGTRGSWHVLGRTEAGLASCAHTMPRPWPMTVGTSHQDSLPGCRSVLGSDTQGPSLRVTQAFGSLSPWTLAPVQESRLTDQVHVRL